MFTGSDTMREFLLSQLQGESGRGVTDLCLDHKLIGDIHPGKFSEINGLDLFPDLEKFSATLHRIASMEGIQAAPRLQELDLSLNEISDISPVQFLQRLQVLNLSHNEIASLQDISFPASLRALDLSFNQLTDISALGGLGNLDILTLNGNRGLAVLEGLPSNLRELHIAQCFVQDHEAIARCARLQTLSISPGSMVAIRPLSRLPHLLSLNLHAARLHGTVDLPPLSSLQHLRIHKAQQVHAIHGFHGLPNLQHLEINYSQLDAPPDLSACMSLRRLEIKFSPLKGLAGIAELPALEELVLTGSSMPKGLDALRAARPGLLIEI